MVSLLTDAERKRNHEKVTTLQLRCIVVVVASQFLVSCSPRVESNPTAVVQCRSPNSDRTTPMKNWKFQVVRTQLLKLTLKEGSGTTIGDLERGLAEALTPEELKQIGALKWAVETVRLELEVRGELVRSADSGKVRYTRTVDLDST